jgi:hypothetical protein
VPIIIEDDDYLEVVQDIQHALGAAGIRTDVRPAPAVLRFSLRVLAGLSGRRTRSRAAGALAVLHASDAEILVHPADLVIGAAAHSAGRLRAVLALKLTYTRAHLTYSQEAHEIEDELRTLWAAADDHTVRPEDLGVLRAIEARAAVLEVDFEEWEILQRQVLLLDRHLRTEIDRMAGPEREPVIRQAVGVLGRTLARAAVQTVRTLVNDGKGVAVMSRVSAVFEHQNDADRAINWLREQGVPDGQIRAVTRDRRAEEMPTDREPPGETVVEVTLDGTRLTTQQLEAGLRRLNAKIGAA